MKPLIFDLQLHIGEIVLVGLGGTGCQWARSIARMVFAMKERRRNIPQVTFIDPDLVEEKNIGRQLFGYGDIGGNKAEVLARRFNCTLGLAIGAIPEAFDARSHLPDTYGYRTVLCAAVDNHLARRELAAADRHCWIDAGNHRASGQVVIGNCADWAYIEGGLESGRDRIEYLPSPALIFPQLLEPEAVEDNEINPLDSCADWLLADEQSILINSFMANIASEYLRKLLYREPISTFLTTFHSDPLAMRSLPITPAEVLAYR